jgi:threonine dehydrogenase-like Zn-dependent dehydrogenase
MKSLVWEAPRVLAIREQDTPVIKTDEVLIKVAFAGICGSELSGYLGHNKLRVPPLVMGHEFSGEIASMGSEVTEQYPALALGQSVTVNPLASCGACRYCVQGLNHLCQTRQLIGAHRPGAYAEYVSVPASLVLPLPAGLSLRTAALTEPAAVGIRIGELADPVEDETALVIGAGPIGLLALQVLVNRGAKCVYIADLDPARRAMGEALGGLPLDPAEVNVPETMRKATDGLGVAVSIDAVGMAVTRANCVAATRSGGHIILSGLHEEVSTLPISDIIRRELNLHGSFAYSPENFKQALDQINTGQLRLDPWVIESPLETGGDWFERLLSSPGNVSKVLLVPSAST